MEEASAARTAATVYVKHMHACVVFVECVVRCRWRMWKCTAKSSKHSAMRRRTTSDRGSDNIVVGLFLRNMSSRVMWVCVIQRL